MPRMTKRKAELKAGEVSGEGGIITITDKRKLKTYMTIANQFNIGKVIRHRDSATKVEKYQYTVFS